MRYHAKLLAFVALTFTSIAHADESIVERLQKTGVRVQSARVNDDGETTAPTRIVIPHDWKWTDQAVLLVREVISTLDTPPTIYIAGPHVAGHEKADNLKKDFPNLTVKRISAAFLGVTCVDGFFVCKVHGVISGSPAESAGLRKGDTIVGVNEKAIDNFKMLQSAIRKFVPDESIEIHVKRELKDLKIKVTLSALPLPPIRGEPSDAPESSKTPSNVDAVPLGPGDR